jgi:hypothetical protein
VAELSSLNPKFHNIEILCLPSDRNLASVGRVILRSDRIVVVLAREKMLSKAIKYSNAENILIAGLAVGMNKKTLILKEASSFRMVDLRGITMEFNPEGDEDNLIHHVDAFLKC